MQSSMLNIVTLRAMEPEDHVLINQWRNDKELQSLSAGTAFSVSLEAEKAWVASKTGFSSNEKYWSVCLQSSKKMIGYISLNNIDYIHRKADWGGIVIGERGSETNGASFDAAYQMLDFAFSQLNLHRVCGYWRSDHAASIMLGGFLGFKREGRFRDSLYKDGSYHDQIIMAILKEEFLSLKESLRLEGNKSA